MDDDPLDRLESHLAGWDAAGIKRIAAFWAGPDAAKQNKQGNLKAIHQALSSPARLQSLADSLAPAAHAALWLIRWQGEDLTALGLAVRLAVLGLIPFEDTPPQYPMDQELAKPIAELANRGLLLAVESPSGYYYGGSWGYHLTASTRITADERLLPLVKPFAARSLPVRPADPPRLSRHRRPQEVTLRLVEFLSVLRKLPKLDFTKAGRPTAALMKRILKAAPWLEAVPGTATPLANTVGFWLEIAVGLGALRPGFDGELGQLTEIADDVTEFSEGILGRGLLLAWQELPVWTEGDGIQFSGYSSACRVMRGALSTALGLLPDPEAWYSVEGPGGLAETLWEAFRGRVSIGYVSPPPYSYHRSQDAQKRAAAEWEIATRTSWLKREGSWLRAALTGPLYQLGLVELADAETTDTAQTALDMHLEAPADSTAHNLRFRLTPLGRLTLNLQIPDPEDTDAAPQEAEPCWVVQPNLEVLVYTQHATPRRLAFMARIGERLPNEGPVVTYRLTRESVYRGLESGLDLEPLLAELTAGAMQPISPSIIRTLSDWSARRDRLTFTPFAPLLEFPTQEARDAALANGHSGRPVGERLILLSKLPSAKQMKDWRVVDYRQGPKACLTATEDGRLQLYPEYGDLLIRAELARWAEPDPDAESTGHWWRLTPASVAKASRATAGGAAGLLAALKCRLREPMPPWLEETLINWAEPAKATHAGLGSVTVLNVRSDAAAEALWRSKELKAMLVGRLGPRSFVVKPTREEDLRSALKFAGIQLDMKVL